MRVIIESPFAGDEARNRGYAQRCMYDSLYRGEAPFLSHLLYTQVLNDKNKTERALGINAGYAWWDVADKIIFYVDYGWSGGMHAAYMRCIAYGKEHLSRTIGAP